MARRTSMAARRFEPPGGAGLSGNGPGAVGRQLYGFGLLLLVVLFFLLTFRGKAPAVLDRVFAPPVDGESVQQRRAQVAELLDGAYHDPADGAGFAETPGYVRILRRLIDHVRPGDIVADPPLFDRELAMRNPELQRGETVKVRGVVADHWAQRMEVPVFEVADVWRVFLTDGDGDNGIVVDVVSRPPVLEPRRDMVEIVGTFYRLVGYETKAGKRLQIPYLLARSLAVLPEVRRSPFSLEEPAMYVLMLAIAGMAVWGIVRVVAARARPQVRWRAPHIT